MKQQARPEQRATLSISEVASLLGTGLNQTYEAARVGEIPTIKIGRRVLVPRAAFERLLADESQTTAIEMKKTA